MFSANASQVSSAANYIEDVFSTYLYTGNGSTQTITNGIDLAGKGGAVWFKRRDGAENHEIYDTSRGVGNRILPNLTIAQASGGTLSAFNSNGFSMIADGNTNQNTFTYASWTFRKQAKFFDVVTWTGDGTSNRQINHSLGSTPGCVIVKNTSSASDWPVYHRSLGFSTGGAPYNGLRLNGTNATGTYDPPISAASSTTITVTTSGSNTNQNGQTFVAYLFAHNAGGFGTAGTDNVISCGSFTTDGSGNATVNLGYEPQWMLVRASSSADNWAISDNMRGQATGSNNMLLPNSSDAESAYNTAQQPTSTGFTFGQGYASATYIYIAIRRGPMKTPTSGTSVFSPLSFNSSSSAQTINPGITTDLCMLDFRDTTNGFEWFDRLRGITGTSGSGNPQITSVSTAAEANSTDINGAGQTTLVAGGTLNGYTQIVECFRRAPSFMDVVCYTGTGSATTFNHNLGVIPEMMIVKRRGTANAWAVYANNDNTDYLVLNTSAATVDDNTYWNDTSPTSSVFSVGTNNAVNASGSTYVAYLFATCAGVSKVGSYTGTGTTKQIDCGFTGGARFVLIKRTDSTGDWYVWDSARGIVSGNDPYLLLNSTAAEVTNTDYVDTYSAGFEISSTAPAAINANGGSFVFFAVA